MDKEEDFYTVMEFSNKLRIHPNTVRKLVKSGKIQSFRIGEGPRSDYRIPKTEISRICEFDMMKLIERMIDEKMEKKNVP